MLPESAKLALRLGCKQLKWEIDHLVGLQITVGINNDSKNVEWIKHILIRNLKIVQYDGSLKVNSPWISFLTNGDFIYLRVCFSEIDHFTPEA